MHSQQRTQFNTAVFITADIVGQTFFHFNKTLGFVKGTERSDRTGFAQLFNQLITVAAVFQKSGGDFDGTLGGGNLEISFDNIKGQVLGNTAGALFADHNPVTRLLGVEKCQTEVNNTQRQINIEIVDRTILTGAVSIGQSVISSLSAAGSRRVVSVGKIITSVQLRQHAEHFSSTHFFGNVFFNCGNLEFKVVLARHFDTFLQRKFLTFHHLAVTGKFKMLDSIFSTFITILFRRFTAADCNSCKNTKHEQFTNSTRHLQKSPIFFWICYFV